VTSTVLKNNIAAEFLSSKKLFEDINPVDGSLVAMVAQHYFRKSCTRLECRVAASNFPALAVKAACTP
jgi:hypothetical protein